MSIGDHVFVAIPLTGGYSGGAPRGVVYTGTVIAVGDRDEVVVKNEHGIHTYGGPYSGTKVFPSEPEAWRHCAEILGRSADALSAAASECEAKAQA